MAPSKAGWQLSYHSLEGVAESAELLLEYKYEKVGKLVANCIVNIVSYIII